MGWFIKVEYEPESEVVEETYLCRSLGDIEETVEWLKDESDGGAIMRVTKTRTDDGVSQVLYDKSRGVGWSI